MSTDQVLRHTGPILWLQQFWAMFLKRFYNSLRYYVAIITQLILPLVFMFLALVLIKIPNNTLGDQPRRLLTLHNSALSRNITAFWAQFGDPPPHLNFSVSFTYMYLCTHMHFYAVLTMSCESSLMWHYNSA